MEESNSDRPKVLIIFFSFSRQTRKLVQAVAEGMESQGVDVVRQRLVPVETLNFPFKSISTTFLMMLLTLLRKRIPIRPLDKKSFHRYDMIILAGPTWSYNPSGPVLSFLDDYGERILKNQLVLPIISCRSYWRTHWYYLKGRIRKCHGIPLTPWAFTHNVPEPWKTVGVFLTIAGKNPKRIPILKKFYTRYGHSNRQLALLKDKATALARELWAGRR